VAQKLHEIIKVIVDTIFKAEERRIQAWTDRLCRANQEFHPGCQMFFWGNRWFRLSNVAGNVPLKHRKPLHSSLCEDADNLLKDAQLVDNDKAFVKQTIFSLLEPCKDVQDIRDTLPEYLVDVVQWKQSLSRTRPAAFTIQNNERALRQYEKMLPLLQVYSTARLIY
jgi:hypothetical protein